MKRIAYYPSPFGTVGIAEDGAGVTDLFFCQGESGPGGAISEETPLLRQAAAELAEYFEGRRTAFTVPLSLHGTAFQLADWEALRTIPYGETRSYRQIAEQLGNPKACRAVGMANHRNPVCVFVPCHRVIGQNGSLTGYAGGLKIKAGLLELERRYAEK